MNPQATGWLKTAPIDIPNQMFYDSLSLQHQIDKKAILMRKKGKTDPTNPSDNMAIMPDFDIANLGVHRADGVARICGDFIELYITTSTYLEGKSPDKGTVSQTPAIAEKCLLNSIARSAKRAEKTIRRLVNTNHLTYMWTLTFAPPSEENLKNFDCLSLHDQRDISMIKWCWRQFYLSVNKVYPNFKWLVVFELHDSNKTSEEKRGTWHIHFATDRRLNWEIITRLWGWGFVRFDDFSKPKKGVRKSAVRNPGAYMSKYIGKDFSESNYHVKRYSRSRNMQTPEKIDLATFFARFPSLEGLEMVYHTERKFEHEEKIYLNHNISYAKRESAIEPTIKNPNHTRIGRIFKRAAFSISRSALSYSCRPTRFVGTCYFYAPTGPQISV